MQSARRATYEVDCGALPCWANPRAGDLIERVHKAEAVSGEQLLHLKSSKPLIDLSVRTNDSRLLLHDVVQVTGNEWGTT